LFGFFATGGFGMMAATNHPRHTRQTAQTNKMDGMVICHALTTLIALVHDRW